MNSPRARASASSEPARTDLLTGVGRGLLRFLAAGALLAAASGSGACAPEQATTSLRIAGQAGDASVTIDEQYVGALAYVASHGVALPPGKHRVTVEKAGYFPWDRIVEAGGERIKLDVELVKIPD